MRRLLTKQLRPGMVLGEAIFSIDQEELIIPKGTVLDEKLISKLLLQTAVAVRIEDDDITDEDEDAFAQARLQGREPSHAEKLRATREFRQFRKDFEETFSDFGNRINEVITGNGELHPAEISKPVISLIAHTSGPSSLFDMLHSLRQYSDETYVHSVNVALIANAIGQWLRLPEEDLRVLTQAGLLHDIGKLVVPQQIISKPARLTDEEYRTIQQHAVRGYELVKDKDIDVRIKAAILMHHERCDGTGYPNHLQASQIDAFAKYVAIADVYDAITSARVYRGPLCPFAAIELMEDEGLQKYDTQAIMTFLSNVVNVYLLNRVRLNDGREGEVVFIHPSHFSRPTVRIGEEYLDLSLEPLLHIETII